MVKVRLDRTKRGQKTFRIVIIDSRMKNGSGRVIDRIGHYNALKKTNNIAEKVVLDIEKYDMYLAQGAQPTEALVRLVNAIKKNEVR